MQMMDLEFTHVWQKNLKKKERELKLIKENKNKEAFSLAKKEGMIPIGHAFLLCWLPI